MVLFTEVSFINILNLLYTTYLFILKAFAIYFGIISLFSLLGKKKEKHIDRFLKFAVLIPARNEQDCITNIIISLKKQDYPHELIDIYVIPNNCTDDTASIATARGAYVLHAPSNVKYKGGALRFAINELINDKENYDAFLIFDADNVASPNFISSMNQTLGNGARVAKSRILAKNNKESWLATCYDIHFCTANLFLNRARVRLGLSARVVGTGFAVMRSFLKELGGFNTISITEDAEFFAICAIKGEKIAFCEDAITYDEQTTSFKASMSQRKRWMSGIMHVVLLKFNDLIKALFTKNSFKYAFDALIQLIFTYAQSLIPFAFVLSILISSNDYLIHTLPLTIFRTYLYVVLIALIVLSLEKRLVISKNIIIGILLYPFFVLCFIPLQTISLFKKTVDWKQIKHVGKPTSLDDQSSTDQLQYFDNESKEQ
ncbi:MAG: glycosyltransferase family 2 protein [Erysipelotrichaceae bacterium]|nr:glycosyltransferase family 2 protein [Erysipelotrichaceae bacterium]MDD3924220.1 glycosyltransferase family 2 protein [Erysipelotrichaceae bacterium]